MKSPEVLEIKEIMKKLLQLKLSYSLKWKEKTFLPGNFLMIVEFKDEKPMSISHMNFKNIDRFTVKL